jgi:hypothetical protein
VVWACGHGVGFLDHHGESYPGSVPRLFGSRVAAGDPAVGDIDQDGRSEVVVALSDAVYAFPMDTAGLEMIAYFEADVSAAPTLGDVDLDGDLEITVPLENGVLHLLDHDGDEHPGSWPVTVSATELRGTAIAQCLATSEPEIAVTALGAQVDLLEGDGSSGAFWPVVAGDWEVHGGPIIGVIDASPDVIVAARRPQGWSWDNIGQVNPGWPRDLAGTCYRTPAYGDIDLDGRTEVVFLTIGKLEVFDVVTAPSSGNLLWAMAGHDPERSGCADCAADVVAVDDAPGGVTRVSMAVPWPNPISGQATFAYAVPVRAQVELAIYDLRGRRLAVVERVEQTAGRHTVAWHGRDTAGRAVASGQYVAALTVRGPGVHETVSRKITVLR